MMYIPWVSVTDNSTHGRVALLELDNISGTEQGAASLVDSAVALLKTL